MHIKHVYSENIEYTDVKITNKYTVLYIYSMYLLWENTPNQHWSNKNLYHFLTQDASGRYSVFCDSSNKKHVPIVYLSLEYEFRRSFDSYQKKGYKSSTSKCSLPPVHQARPPLLCSLQPFATESEVTWGRSRFSNNMTLSPPEK